MSGSADHCASLDRAPGLSLTRAYPDEGCQRFTVVKAAQITRIRQHFGHGGLANAGNAGDQFGICFKFRVAVDMVVDVALQFSDLLVEPGDVAFNVG